VIAWQALGSITSNTHIQREREGETKNQNKTEKSHSYSKGLENKVILWIQGIRFHVKNLNELHTTPPLVYFVLLLCKYYIMF
jgi:hypothetical protein